jgi:hypothetical protein
VVAVLGDVVASRSHGNRQALQRTLEAAFVRVAGAVRAIQPFTMTIGDEFQALFRSVAAALEATLRLRLLLIDEVDVRLGVGYGAVAALDEGREPFGQDGPGWWRARQALENVADAQHRYGWPRTWRTGWIDAGERGGPVHGYLMLRDQLIAGFDRVDADITLALLDGETQSAMANRLGVDRSAVSRRVASHGISAILRSGGIR